MNKDERERLERVEQKVDALTEQFSLHREQFSRYRGFVGGVIFTVSAVWAIVLAAISYFTTKT